jgi:hypothetical protein
MNVKSQSQYSTQTLHPGSPPVPPPRSSSLPAGKSVPPVPQPPSSSLLANRHAQQRTAPTPPPRGRSSIKESKRLGLAAGILRNEAEQKQNYSIVSPAQARRALDLMEDMENPPSADRLTAFAESEEHYELLQDKNVAGPFPGIKLGPQGRRLLVDHYRRKYNADIVLPGSDQNPVSHVTFASVAQAHIEPLRKRPGDVRCAFNLGGKHAVPVIYIKERGREALLVADSLGGSKSDVARALADQYGLKDITIYRVDENRQLDYFSCYADAMKFAATITGHVRNEDGSFGDYLLPNVLEELESRRKESIYPGNVWAVTLPAELAKLAQIDKFIGAQKGTDPEKRMPSDPKRRTLTDFRDPYETTVTWKKPGKTPADPTITFPRSINDSLRHKGFRYAELIQIAHYNRQMEDLFPDKWPAARQLEFERCLKRVVREDRAAAMPASDASNKSSPRAEGKV